MEFLESILFTDSRQVLRKPMRVVSLVYAGGGGGGGGVSLIVDRQTNVDKSCNVTKMGRSLSYPLLCLTALKSWSDMLPEHFFFRRK